MEKHFFFISLRKTLFLTATFVLLIGNTQPSYAMLGVDEELQVMQNGIVNRRHKRRSGDWSQCKVKRKQSRNYY